MGMSPAEKALRTAAVYFALLGLLRVAGKRELLQFTAFDLVVLLLLSNVVQNAVIGPDTSLVGGLLGAAILVLGNYFVVRFAFFHPGVGRAMQGRETVLVADGHVREKAMRRELIADKQLDAGLRRLGVDDGLHGVE